MFPVISRHRRRAFSLVEVLVALVLFAGGLLALGTTAVSSLRLESMAVHRQRAAALVLDRAERLRSAGCASAAGTDSASGVAVHWRIDRASRLTEFFDSAIIRDVPGAAPRRERVRGALPC